MAAAPARPPGRTRRRRGAAAAGDVPEPLVASERPPAPPPHSAVENVLGVLTGTFVVSFGLQLLRLGGAATGGTAGLSLVVGYAVPLPFAAVFLLVNLPFFVLAWVFKGPAFTLRSALSVALVSGFSLLHPRLLEVADLAPAYGVLAGNLLVGIGLLVLFRHGSSVGGFNILALLAQDRLGWRAGYVQMALDVVVVLLALLVLPPPAVLLSAAGAALLNLVLALNHRPGRYLAG